MRGFNRPGDFGGRILTLVDGLRINDPIYDSAGSLHDFPVDVDMMERVEIIRGPGSALYGNNAFFAVINVITRKAADVRGGEISGALGSFNTAKGRLTYGQVFENGVSLLLTGSLLESAGNPRLSFKEFDEPANNRGCAEGRDDDAFASAALTLGYGDFLFQSGYVSRRKDVPTASFDTLFNDPNFHTLDQRAFTRLLYAHAFENALNVRFDLHFNSYYYQGDYPYAADPPAPHRPVIFRDIVDAQWWGAELQFSRPLFDTHQLTWGGEFQDNARLRLAGDSVPPRIESQDLRTATSTVGVYVQVQHTSDAGTVDPLSNSPGHLAKLGLIVPVYGEKALAALELQYSSAVENTREERTPGFVLANFTLSSRELLKNLDASLSVHNVFDRKYGYPGGPEHLEQTLFQDGRTFLLKLTYRS